MTAALNHSSLNDLRSVEFIRNDHKSSFGARGSGRAEIAQRWAKDFLKKFHPPTLPPDVNASWKTVKHEVDKYSVNVISDLN